jgi:hypothetical protein
MQTTTVVQRGQTPTAAAPAAGSACGAPDPGRGCYAAAVAPRAGAALCSGAGVLDWG